MGRSCLIKIYPASGLEGLFELGDQPVTLGRDSDCDFELVDSSVSGKHAKIEPHGDSYYLQALQSSHGTFVNEDRIDRRILQAGDLIRIGNQILKFLSADHIEAQYHETVYAMTTRDGLTGTYNKRYLLDALQREVSRSQRHRRPLSVIIFDIDRFKAVNDTHGHLAGDEVLKELSRRIHHIVREDELFARYGGEEFVILMSEATLEQAVELAHRVRQSIANEPFATQSATIEVTISLGLAQMTGDEEVQADELLKQADDKLYLAKNAGRNCVRY